MYVLGLDVGTTGCKAAVFDENVNIVGYGFKEYDVIYKGRHTAEQDPRAVWNAVKDVLKQAISKCVKSEIKALSVSVQGDAVVPVDKALNPLHNVVLGMDYRADAEASCCANLIGGKKLFEITGMRAHPITSLSKILWFKNHMPEIFEKTFKFMTYSDYILAKLGAEPAIDWTMASRTMAFDLQARQWSEYILKEAGLNQSLLSKPVEPGKIIGTISKDVACDIGLPEGLLLVSGGHDQTCAALGAGCIKEGIGVDSHGTAEVLSTTFERPVLSDSMYQSFYPCYLHAKKDMYFTFALNHTAGIVLKWYRDNFAHAEIEEAQRSGITSYARIESKISHRPSQLLVLPHFNGSGTPWCDLDSKGAIVGITLSTDRHDLACAIMEAMAYELRINVEHMKEAGIIINEIRAVGGGAKSDLSMQIKADILGFPIKKPRIGEAACLGVALLALAAMGAYSSIDEAVAANVKMQKEYLPDPEKAEKYAERYEIYKDLYVSLKSINKKLSEVTRCL